MSRPKTKNVTSTRIYNFELNIRLCLFTLKRHFLNPHLPNSHVPITAWIKPDRAWSELNIVRSATNKHFAIEGVVRNDQGLWQIGFGKYIGLGTVLMAKAWALFTGLQIVKSINTRKNIIEVDNEELFPLMSNYENPFLC